MLLKHVSSSEFFLYNWAGMENTSWRCSAFQDLIDKKQNIVFPYSSSNYHEDDVISACYGMLWSHSYLILFYLNKHINKNTLQSELITDQLGIHIADLTCFQKGFLPIVCILNNIYNPIRKRTPFLSLVMCICVH